MLLLMVCLVVIGARALRFKTLLINLVVHCHILVYLVQEVRIYFKFELILFFN